MAEKKVGDEIRELIEDRNAPRWRNMAPMPAPVAMRLMSIAARADKINAKLERLQNTNLADWLEEHGGPDANDPKVARTLRAIENFISEETRDE